MSKLSCNIVRDLLPLYCDMVLEPESIKELEEHLKGCPACQEMYEKMNRELSEECRTDKGKEAPEIQTLFKKIKMRNRIIVGIVVSIIFFLSGSYWKIPPNAIVIEDMYIDTAKYDHPDPNRIEYVNYFNIDLEGRGVDEFKTKVYQRDHTIYIEAKRSLFSIIKNKGLSSQIGASTGCPIEQVENIKQVYFNGDLIWNVEVDGAIPER